jgi:arylsulfatase A-like enzyme
MKDRAAIFPAGHEANGAYWYDTKTGNFITSSYYMKDLPQWMNRFNDRDVPDSLFRLNWDLSMPASVYQKYCGADDEEWEGKPFGASQKNFPYTLSQYAQKDYSRMTYTPHANTLLESLAETAIVNENLGHNTVTDFLTVSFSAPDYIGHTFGPESWEQLDDYLRLDKTLGRLFDFLDKQVGAGNYLVFLSADHGAANSPGYAVKHDLPGGAFNKGDFAKGLKQILLDKYKTDHLIKASEEYEITLNDALIDSLSLDKATIEKTIIDYAEKSPGIVRAVSMQNISTTTLTAVEKKMFSNAYFPQRSGDIMFVLQPGYVSGDGKGTSHGLWNPYDAHIPLLWYGWNIRQGKTNRETYMTDIAATLAALLHIQMPSGCVGTVIEEVMK